MIENNVYVYKTHSTEYPKNPPYHANLAYPEYPFDSQYIDKDNNVYSDIRDLFFRMGFDKENFNKPSWNPFKDFIAEGNTVLIKPNLVMHINKNLNDDIKCLITNGSIIRAIVDYVYIALKGRGRIIIADAPVQSCNMEVIKDITGINDIIKLYKSLKFEIEVIDFRKERASMKKNDISAIEKLKGDPSGYTVVDLKNKSAFKDKNNQLSNLRVTNYDYNVMIQNHNSENHRYLIPNTVLNADVIINLPKPKTHRKAGMTAAMKNFVGISGNKAWLPHHTKGAKENGGDEYLNNNPLKSLSTSLQEKIDILSINKRVFRIGLLRLLRRVVRLLLKFQQKDIYYEGSWWGNDTIWRTVMDLNRIVMCVDKKGEIHDKRQRRVFSLLDAIVAGEGEGPLLPSSKTCSLLIAGFNQLSIDTVMASIMGFEMSKIPTISNSYKEQDFILSKLSPEDIIINSNVQHWNGNIMYQKPYFALNFKPTAGWIGHIEK